MICVYMHRKASEPIIPQTTPLLRFALRWNGVKPEDFGKLTLGAAKMIYDQYYLYAAIRN